MQAFPEEEIKKVYDKIYEGLENSYRLQKLAKEQFEKIKNMEFQNPEIEDVVKGKQIPEH